MNNREAASLNWAKSPDLVAALIRHAMRDGVSQSRAIKDLKTTNPSLFYPPEPDTNKVGQRVFLSPPSENP